MPTNISDLWIPDIWVPAIRERQATFPALFNSGIVARGEYLDILASGPGTSVNVPFLNDITDQDDELQVENTAPLNDLGQPGEVQNFPICNRVKKNSATALAKQLSGADPMAAIIDQMVMTRMKNRQKDLVAMLRGLFGTSAGAGVDAAMAAMRYKDFNGSEPFTEAGANPPDSMLFSYDVFEGACALMGELADTLRNGCILLHPHVKSRLKILDEQGFRSTVRPSELPFTVDTYHEIPIFTSVSLARPGVNNGFIYETYIITKDTVGFGEKPQQGDTTDVASLQYWRDRDLNNELIWDRVRFLMGINGTKWIGTPANAVSGPTRAELANAANWQLAYQSADRVGAVCVRTNG